MPTTGRERGAIIPMVALLLVVLIPSAAMAVDLGMQRVVRRDMQALADVVALDLVRLVDGRTAGQIRSGHHGRPTLDLALLRSVARNDDVLGNEPVVTVRLAHIDQANGRLDHAGGVTREVVGAEVPNAIEVTARGSIDFAFAPGSGRATRTAVAVPAPAACFRLGSFAAGIDTNSSTLLASLMPGFLDVSTVNVSAVGYQGLAALNVSLLDLVAVSGLGVGSPDALLVLDELSVADFYAAMASAVQANGGPTASVVALQTLSASATLAGAFKVRDLLEIASADTAALSAQLNVLDLVLAAAQLVNGTNALDVSGTVQPLVGLVPGAGTTRLTVVESPRLACGGRGTATARTAQVSLELTGNKVVQNPVVLAGFPAQATVDTTLTVHANLAKAEGTLTNIICGEATLATNAEGIDVAVTPGLSSLSSSGTTRITTKVNVPLVGQVAVDLLVPLTAAALAQSGPATAVSFRHPPDAYGTAKSFGSTMALSPLSAPTVSSLDATVTVTTALGTSSMSLNAPGLATLRSALQTVVTSAAGTANTVNSKLNSLVIAPLASQLGVKLGGADLFAIARPSCSDPSLAG
jgi:uncharacterized membrane protein